MVEGLQNIDLAGYARSEGMELKRTGNRYVACCPLHGPERTPSFFIFPDHRFKCFGCGESGDAVDLVQKVHGLTFQDALAHLGLKQGPVTPETRQQIEERKRRGDLVMRFRKWEIRKADQAATMIRCINKVSATWKTPDDLEKHGDILTMLPALEHELSILCSRDDRKKFELLTGQRAKVTQFNLGREIGSWFIR